MLALISRAWYQGFINSVWSANESSFKRYLQVLKKGVMPGFGVGTFPFASGITTAAPVEAYVFRLGMLQRLGGKGYEWRDTNLFLTPPPSCSFTVLWPGSLLLHCSGIWSEVAGFIENSIFSQLKFTAILLGISIIDASFLARVHGKLWVTQLLRC